MAAKKIISSLIWKSFHNLCLIEWVSFHRRHAWKQREALLRFNGVGVGVDKIGSFSELVGLLDRFTHIRSLPPIRYLMLLLLSLLLLLLLLLMQKMFSVWKRKTNYRHDEFSAKLYFEKMEKCVPHALSFSFSLSLWAHVRLSVSLTRTNTHTQMKTHRFVARRCRVSFFWRALVEKKNRKWDFNIFKAS